MKFFSSKNFWFNLGLLFGSIVLSLILVEIVLRLTTPKVVEDDPVLGVRGAPASDWDMAGFRNEKVLTEAKVVALGDSQTEGNNASREEAWPQVLGRLMNKSVYQIAAGGYGPVQYNYLFDEALKKKPEIIIIGFYLGNDLLDAERLVYSRDYWKSWRLPGYQAVSSSTNYRLILSYGLEPGTLAYKFKLVRDWLRNYVYLYALAGNATRSWRENWGLASKLSDNLADVSRLSIERPDLVWVYEDAKVGTVLSPTYRLISVDLSEAKAQEGWRLTKRAISELVAKANKAQVRLIINVIPTKEAVYLTKMEKSGEPIPENFSAYWQAEKELNSLVGALCRELKIECVYPLGDLASSLTRGEKIYGITMDGHPLNTGYEVIARYLYKYLGR